MSKSAILSITRVCNEYIGGMSSHELGKKYDCSPKAVLNCLRNNNVNIRTSGESKTIKLPLDIIYSEYISGMSARELGRKYKCSYDVILRNLRDMGVVTRTRKEATKLDLPIDMICSEYMNGVNLRNLGDKYNCAKLTIKRHLQEQGMTIRTHEESKNVIISCICVNCGHVFSGKPNMILCPNCNDSGYCHKFDHRCREHNRNKYDRRCFICEIHEDDCNVRHSVHHIDYNKNQGCGETPDWKLVPLCQSCHGMTQGGINSRKLWESRIMWLLDNIWAEK